MKNLLLIFLLSTSVGFAQVPTYVPTSGLLGWWPFNGNANDESGNSNNGTVNGATLTTDRFGNANKAYSFNGTSDYIRCLNAGPTGNPTITLSFWVKTSQTTASDVFNWGSGTIPGQDFRACFNEAGCAGITFDNYNSARTYTTLTNTNVWEHYIVVYDSIVGNTVLSAKTYKNGVLLSSACFTQNLDQTNIGSANPITIGRYNKITATPQPPNYFSGILDDIAIWNRILTANEILNLYNSCNLNATITPPTSNPTLNSNAQFTASSGSVGVTYQWQSDHANFGWTNIPSNSAYSGVTANILTVNNVQFENHQQQFRIIAIYNSCIDTSNIAVLNIADTCILSVTDTLIINTTITGLTSPNNENIIKVFPNPTSDHITINYGNYALMSGYTLKITNLSGQVLFTTPINQQSTYIDLSTWTGNGIYFVHIIDALNNTVDVRKIVLE